VPSPSGRFDERHRTAPPDLGLYSLTKVGGSNEHEQTHRLLCRWHLDSPAKHTNVYKLYKALLVSANQMPFYDDGVGADGNPISKLLDGAFGTGLWQKIKDGYAKIAQVYEAGDQLYLFGFSRGAYTARSLAGMIAACGLPTKSFTDDLALQILLTGRMQELVTAAAIFAS